MSAWRFFISPFSFPAKSKALRMGPIFGGMFLSGRKAALEILEKLKK